MMMIMEKERVIKKARSEETAAVTTFDDIWSILAWQPSIGETASDRQTGVRMITPVKRHVLSVTYLTYSPAHQHSAVYSGLTVTTRLGRPTVLYRREQTHVSRINPSSISCAEASVPHLL